MKSHALFVVLALVIIGGGWWFAHRNDPAIAVDPADSATSTASGTAQKAPTPAKKDTGGSHAGLSYGEAVKIFADRRIQFDQNCTAIPNYIVLKNGTNVMFDNRSSTARYMLLDRNPYLLRGYDFRILTLHSPKLPHTIKVDCGSGRNNGQIVLN